MHLIYSENTAPMNGAFDPLRCDAVKKWSSHYGNSLYLAFMLERGTTLEKMQASKELTICERKMAYWSRQPHFDKRAAEREAARLKRQWAR